MTHEFINTARSLRNKYLVFLGIIIVIIITNVPIIRHNTQINNEAATIINVSGRQRMLSQRISKLTYNITTQIREEGKPQEHSFDSLNKFCSQFSRAHNALLYGNGDFGITVKPSSIVKQQIENTTLEHTGIINAAKRLITHPDTLTSNAVLDTMRKYDIQYLLEMESIVSQLESEYIKKQHNTYIILLSLSAISLIIILLSFALIVLPTIRKLNTANDLLIQTTDRLFMATGAAQIGIWEYDVKTDKLIWDDEMHRIYGISPGDLRGVLKAWFKTIHPDDVSRVVKELRMALHGKGDINSEFKILRADGAVRIIKVQAVSNYNRYGKVVKLTGINLDITDQRNTEKIIKEGRESLAKAQQIAKLGSWEWDINTGKEIWSDEQYRIFGFEPGEISPNYNSFTDRMYPDDVDKVLKAIADTFDNTKPYKVDFRIRPKQGGIKYIEALGEVYYDDKGKPKKMIGTALDVTERKLLEAEKKNIENILEQTSKTALIGTWEIDLTTNEMKWDTMTKAIYEVPADYEPTVETSLNFIKDEMLREKYSAEMAETIKTEVQHDLELQMVTAKGNTRWVRVISQADVENGKCLRLYGLIQNIDKQKEKEAEQKSYMDIIGEQNKRLLNFAHIVSHNLRSHSGNMEMVLGLYDDSETISEKEEMVNHLKGISLALSDAIKNLNEVVSIQTNINKQREKINLKSYIDKTIDVLSGEITLKGGTIINNVPAETEVSFNAAYMESILLNFLSNGIKYRHPERSPVVALDMKVVDGKKVLQITDNGLGIDLEKHGEKLFGMYKTFHGNSDAKGIGLFITKNQVEVMGGKIEVESEVNKGTTFKIFLQ
jgi:PAS domain S-box-containing protein